MTRYLAHLVVCLLVALSSACGVDPIEAVAQRDRGPVSTDADLGVGFDLSVFDALGQDALPDTSEGDTSDEPDIASPDVTPDADGSDSADAADLFDEPDLPPDPSLVDSDGDGIADIHEGRCAVDSDFDGIVDCRDLDSDNDRIPDSVEAGDNILRTLPIDSDGDLRPDFIDGDSDNDGIDDVIEGADDLDGDDRGNWRDDDSDGDGISDRDEGLDDPDGDLWPNFADLDSDGDTISDRDEGLGPHDLDDIPDYLDLDSDEDGISDATEAGDDDLDTAPWDSDRDGLPDFQDTESDGDGIADDIEGTGDPDADGRGNWRDRDSDGDFISDLDEADRDSDTDGTLDRLDTDSDNDGISDAIESGDTSIETAPIDTDRDDLPDFRDPDSDNDALSDAFEGTVDSDGDGLGNWIDFDSDGDTIGDLEETATDSDGDGTPNYLDIDSDNDTISDLHESLSDSDRDGTPDRLDSDSDNDGVSDGAEAGDADLATLPVDTDRDGRRDYLDIDSDNDGLADGDERGCPASSDRLLADTDSDGFTDLSEVAVGSSPCSAASDVYDFTDFFFVLPPDVEEDAPLEFSTDVQQADVHFNMDTTGSMGSEISALRGSLSGTIIPQVAGVVSNVAFGVSSFRDFPVGNFGSPGDYPFRLDQSITTVAASAQAGVNRLAAGGGNDGPESGWESLYQIATGAGGVSWSGGNLGATPVGWRRDSLPIVVHITDAVSHNASDYSTWVTGEHSRSEAVTDLHNRSIRVIGVASGSSVRSELRTLAVDTDAVVPACAFGNVCGAGQCCTGINGSGEPPEGGRCPLVFNVDGNGNGLSTRVVDAIEFLVTAGTIWVTTRVLPDLDDLAAGIDTSCFIDSVTPDRAVAPDSCAGTPRATDRFEPFGVNDSFDDVTPGTQVFFQVHASNRGCYEPTTLPRAFRATIQVVGDGVTLLDSRDVTVIIPGRLPDQD